MIKSCLKWEQIDEAIKGCKEYQSEVQKKKDLDKEYSALKNQLAEVEEKMRVNVEKPKTIDDFGILSCIRCRVYCYDDRFSFHTGEARIEDINENEMTVFCQLNYNRYDCPTCKISVSELKTKGYVYDPEEQVIIIDQLKTFESYKAVVDLLVTAQKNCLFRDIDSAKNWIKKESEKLAECEKQLKDFEDYKDIHKMGNVIDWLGHVDNKQREEFENNFPRVYKI